MGDLYTDMYNKNYEITGKFRCETERAIYEGADKIEVYSDDISLSELAFLIQCGYKPVVKNDRGNDTVYFTR